jgi:hypothetical protein
MREPREKEEIMQQSAQFSRRVAVVWALGCVATMLFAAEARAATWSAPVTISGPLPIDKDWALAGNQNGDQLWLSRPRAPGGYVVQQASRSAGGSFGTPTTISGLFTTLGSVTAAVSGNGTAAAGWATPNSIQVALRSASGTWSAPVTLATGGWTMNLQLKLDAQGNGVMIWRQVSSIPSVQAVTWTSGGAFGAPVQLSSSSHGAALPDLAMNDAGSAVVTWQAPDTSNPNQVEWVSRAPGGAWSTPAALSPVQTELWSPQVAIDGAGNMAAVWEQGNTIGAYNIYVATRNAGGSWSAPVLRDTGTSWAGNPNVETDAAGHFTAAWVVALSTGNEVHASTRNPGGSFSAPILLGACASYVGNCSRPEVAASADGSLTVVGWGAHGGTNSPNVAVRLGLGGWTHTVLSSDNALNLLVTASNQGKASALFARTPAAAGGYNMDVRLSDYR